MNYVAHYERLIARARGRVLGGYRERHHVVPRCMGGTDDRHNLVDLTPEEHYVAHQLLVKIHPGVKGLATAAVRMAKQSVGRKAYGWLRRKHAENISARMLGNKHTLGKALSAEHRAKVGAASRGRKLPPRSAEHAKKIAAKNIGRKLSPEHRAKLSSVRLGRVPWNKGKHLSTATRAKMAAAHIGNPSNRGRKLSAEHRANVSLSLIGNKRRAGMTPWNKGRCHGR